MDSIVIFLAKYLVIVPVLVFAYLWVRSTNEIKKKAALALVVAAVAALVLAKVSGMLYYHPRPFVSEHIKPLVAHGPDNGFPSEHTILAMTLATLVYFYWRRLAAIMFVTAVLIGAGRVWAHVHSPLDIAGGIVFGAIAGIAGFYGAKFFSARNKN